MSESICASESLRFVFNRLTNFSSVNNASSSGRVTPTEAVFDSTGEGDGDAEGEAVGWTVAVFVLVGAVVQLANKHASTLKINSCRSSIIDVVIATDFHKLTPIRMQIRVYSWKSVAVLSLDAERQEWLRRGAFKKPARADAQSMMPGG